MRYQLQKIKFLLPLIIFPTLSSTTFGAQPTNATGSFTFPSEPPVAPGQVSTVLDPERIKSELLDVTGRAAQQIIVCSPFLSDNSMKRSGLGSLLAQKIQNRVRVGVATCSTLSSGKVYEERAIKFLQDAKASVNFYRNIHAKFIVIDDDMGMMGSFNPLSGSLDTKYQYYQLQIIHVLRGDIFKAFKEHVLAILENRTAPKPSGSGVATIYSASDDLGNLHRRMITSATKTLEICSPNLSLNLMRTAGFLELLRGKASERVNITIYTDSEMDSSKPDAVQARFTLAAIPGINLIQKKGIHLKFVIVDGAELYSGSDNLLAGSTHEGGGGFWRELGIHMPVAELECGEIRRQMGLVQTVMDGAAVTAEVSPVLRGSMPVNPLPRTVALGASAFQGAASALDAAQQQSPSNALLTQQAARRVPAECIVDVAKLPVTPGASTLPFTKPTRTLFMQRQNTMLLDNNDDVVLTRTTAAAASSSGFARGRAAAAAALTAPNLGFIEGKRQRLESDSSSNDSDESGDSINSSDDDSSSDDASDDDSSSSASSAPPPMKKAHSNKHQAKHSHSFLPERRARSESFSDDDFQPPLKKRKIESSSDDSSDDRRHHRRHKKSSHKK